MVSAAGETSSYVPVTNTITNVDDVVYGGIIVNAHELGSSDPSILFNGIYGLGFNTDNVGSSKVDTGLITTINFTPAVAGAAVIGTFSGNAGRTFVITYESGETQDVPVSGAHNVLVEVPLTSSSPVSSITFQIGNSADSQWIAGFKIQAEIF